MPMSEHRPSESHPEPQFRPIVVCICGMLASGKSTLSKALAEHWERAPVLAFDDYEQHAQWPPDMMEWVQDGADPALVSNGRLRDDLQALLDGSSVQHPLTHADLMPSPLVLLEEPFGRTRPDIRDLIDYVLFVELPTDLSVVRLVRRTLSLSPKDSAARTSDDSVPTALQRIQATERWLDHYVAHRQMYTAPHLLGRVRESSDIILDGEKPQEEVRSEAITHIERWMQAIGS